MKQYVLKHTEKDLFSFGMIENRKIISIVSFLLIDYAPSIGSDGKELYIFNVYTKPSYRRKGYAKKVLKFGIDYFKNLNYTCFRLHTNNENAKKLYSPLGFHQSTTSMSLFAPLGR